LSPQHASWIFGLIDLVVAHHLFLKFRTVFLRSSHPAHSDRLHLKNLTITGGSHLGLVGVLKSPGQILGLGIMDANVMSTGSRIGMLAGHNEGQIRQCFSFGSAVGESEVGGLVGRNQGKIEDCFAGGSVSGLYSVGG